MYLSVIYTCISETLAGGKRMEKLSNHEPRTKQVECKKRLYMSMVIPCSVLNYAEKMGAQTENSDRWIFFSVKPN